MFKITLLSIYLTTSFFSQSLYADQNLQCLFSKPFLFGASITAGYGSTEDAMFAMLNNKFGKISKNMLGSNPGPISRLAEKYNESPEIENISELINKMEFGGIGYLQVENYLYTNSDTSKFTEASVVASLDSLYWPSIYNMCEDSIEGTKRLIDYTERQGIPMILATVPDEDPDLVDFHLKGGKKFGITVPASWGQPKKHCLTQINSFLKKYCTYDKKCILIDIHGIIQDLKGVQYFDDPNEEGLIYNGKKLSYNEVRGDGVHLNHKPFGKILQPKISFGVQYLMDTIVKQVKKSGIRCYK